MFWWGPVGIYLTGGPRLLQLLSKLTTDNHHSHNPATSRLCFGCLNLKNQSTNCLKLEHQFTLVPHPQSSNASYLYGITLTYRQPFSPLKWATEGIVFDTQTPLYFTPQTLSHEITHYTLSQRGIALNANLQYTIKHKRKMPVKHKHSPQFYLATRTEIIVKNTTENPVQPRIFVALWLK